MNKTDLYKRIGKFYINWDIILEHPYEVMKVFEKMIVIRAESVYGHRMEYIAFCDLFDIVPENKKPILYEIEFLFYRDFKDLFGDGHLSPLKPKKAQYQDQDETPKKINFKEFL